MARKPYDYEDRQDRDKDRKDRGGRTQDNWGNERKEGPIDVTDWDKPPKPSRDKQSENG